MGTILNLRSIVVVLILCTLMSLAVLGAKVSVGGDHGNITDAQMMKKLANSPGAFVFVDLQEMRADADLENTYGALQRDVEVWIEPLDMDFDEVDRMGLGGRVAVFEGLFHLDQLRCKLKANGFVKTEYRGVETWEKDVDGEIITCPEGSILSWLSCTGCKNPFTGPCFESDSDEEESDTDAEADCGYVDAVALMSSRGTFSRGHETILTGQRDWVRDSIGVIKYGDACIYDDSDFQDIAEVVPGGIAVKYQKGKFLDLYEYEGLEISGISVDKKDPNTLKLRGVCLFADAAAASDAAGTVESDLENDAFGRWENISIDSGGNRVAVTFETDIAHRAVLDLAPPCIGGVTVAGTTMTSAVIAWSTNEPATGEVEYGETETFASMPIIHTGLSTTHALRLIGLSPDTSYHFRVRSADVAGNEAVSADLEFRTLGDLPPDSYTIVDDNRQAALRIQLSRIQLTPTTVLELSLTNPDGVEVGTDSVSPGDTEATLHMARPCVTPEAGTYTLSFADASGRQVVWSEFTFLDVQASVSQVALDWEYYAYAGRYTLYGMGFKLENSGDLPVYVDKVEVTLGALAFEMHIDEMVLPGQGKTISKSTYITGIAPGSKKLILRFMDQTGEVLCTYSSTVVPS